MALEIGDENRLKHLCTSAFSKKTSKGPKSAFFIPESAFFLLTIWKFQKFFVTLHLNQDTPATPVLAPKMAVKTFAPRRTNIVLHQKEHSSAPNRA